MYLDKDCIKLFLFRYFPKGGGRCVVDVNPLRSLKAADITEFGSVERFFGWSFVAGTLPVKVG